MLTTPALRRARGSFRAPDDDGKILEQENLLDPHGVKNPVGRTRNINAARFARF